MPQLALGETIPPNTVHAVSVSLPTWAANVGYEEGQEWVVSRMSCGYPRFFIHKSIQALAAAIVDRHGRPGQNAMLFPSRKAAARCVAFMRQYAEPAALLDDLAVVHLALDRAHPDAVPFRPLAPTLSAVLFAPAAFPLAKQYWQHAGEGVSSRRAEYCQTLFSQGLLVPAGENGEEAAGRKTATSGVVPSAAVSGSAPALAPTPAPAPAPAPAAPPKPFRGPKRYRRPMSPTSTLDEQQPLPQPQLPPSPLSPGRAAPAAANSSKVDDDESARFLEERFGRNLDLSFVQRATSAIKRRITGALTAHNDVELAAEDDAASKASTPNNIRGAAASHPHEDDVFLVPCGMNAIFSAHRWLLAARPDRRGCKSINFGFPYVDTYKILQKFGAGCVFYPHGDAADLDDLEARLVAGERFLGLFCEFPGNPLLTCPDLPRIRRLADAYDFAVVVDETIGTFANVNVMPYADVVVSSLTKIFSGDCNVMGGSIVLNPASRAASSSSPSLASSSTPSSYYHALRAVAAAEHDPDAYWPEDVIFMERNSRDFADRVHRINANAEAIVDTLRASPLVRLLYYPKYCASRAHYEEVRIGGGGGGGGAHVGGYGGLLSFAFHHKAQAVAFYDAIETAKGPSLGTNFTITSPYVLLAHYQELDWCRDVGVDPDLLRVSVGLEDTAELQAVFEAALAAAAAVPLPTS